MRNQWRLWNVSNEYLRVMQGATTVFVLLLVARLIGALKEIVVAYRYGTSPVVDGYLFVFNSTYLIATTLDSISLFVLVPLIARNRLPGQARPLLEFKGELLGAALVAALVAALLSTIILLLLVETDLAGLAGASTDAARAAAYWLPIGLVFAFVSTILFVWSVAREQHIGSLADALPALGICVAVLVSPGGGIAPLIMGTLIGYILRCFFLAGVDSVAADKAAPRFRFRSVFWRDVVAGAGLIALAKGMLAAASLVDTFFAARQGEGALAIYNYAYRGAALLLGLLTIPISRAVLPVFAQGSLDLLDGKARLRMACRFAAAAAGAGLLVACAGWGLADVAVRLFYERGAFTAADTAAVSAVLRMQIVQAPIYASWIVMFYWLVGRRAYPSLLQASGVVLVAKILSGWLLSTNYGLGGLAFSTTVMYLFGFGYTLAATYKRECNGEGHGSSN